MQFLKLELSLLKEIALDEPIHLIQEESVNYEEPLIKFVNQIIEHALQQAASDIHIEPYETICRIRYRCDGLLHEVAQIPIAFAARVMTRLKVMGKLDITERRLPQDGRFLFFSTDIRINACPTLFGEKIVLRLLNTKKLALTIDCLGLTLEQQELFVKKISQPQGLILVTGPTGSGKTVTLYSALHYLNTEEKNILTIEDPIEIQLPGINQINVNPKMGLDFSTALRACLRQDPDVIMVGEIRDSITAEIAIQAAQTGHLVLSTLHTNSAFETLSRLKSMGIATYPLINAISLVISQRLARILCSHCKQSEKLSRDLANTLKLSESTSFFHAIGCQSCLKGYQGRTGIYEVLNVNETIIHTILADKPSAQLAKRAKHQGHMSLYENGLQKVIQGITSWSEINRVLPQ